MRNPDRQRLSLPWLALAALSGACTGSIPSGEDAVQPGASSGPGAGGARAAGPSGGGAVAGGSSGGMTPAGAGGTAGSGAVMGGAGGGGTAGAGVRPSVPREPAGNDLAPEQLACKGSDPPASPARIWRLSSAEWANTVAIAISGARPATPVASVNVPRELSAAPFTYKSSDAFTTFSGGYAMTDGEFEEAASAAATGARLMVNALKPRNACVVSAADAAAVRACVAPLVSERGEHLFRRPLTAEEVARYVEVAAVNLGKVEGGADGATLLASEAMLLAPQFLYRVEVGARGAGGNTLTQYEVAAALSYTLGRRPPDAPLWEAAKGGQLATPEQIRAQVERIMLARLAKLPAENYDTGNNGDYTELRFQVKGARMPITNRRTFIEKLGLGVGATLLSPLAQTLVNEARGQTTARKRAVFLPCSNGLPPSVFTPPGIAVGGSPILPGVAEFTMPRMWKPLEAHRGRMLLIDGLANRVSGEHSGGHGALSGVNVTRFTGQDNGPPGAISIDQFIANGIGRSTAMKSLLWGVGRSSGTLESRIFAAGRERPIPHHITVQGLWERLFGPTGAWSLEVARRRRPLFDVIRKDIAALRAQLATAERAKLDEYSEVLESSEKRLAMLQPVTCARPGLPAVGMTVEARLAAVNELSIVAVVCGLTNVVGISVGCGNGHDAPLMTELHRGSPFEGDGNLDLGTLGHFPDKAPIAQVIVFTHMAKLVARMVEVWSGVKEGGRSIFDDMVIVVTSDNGEQHHSKKDRWPVAVIGNAGGALRADGRFLRYQPGGSRALADLYSSVATAVGAPTDRFGQGGVEQIKGPLPELMA